MVTIKDVIKEAGVFTATVSGVLNNDYSVNNKSWEKVLEACGKFFEYIFSP